MKIAIVTDFLNQFGGAEIVTHEIAKLFPDADIYTIFGNDKVINKYFSNKNVYQHPKFKISKVRRKFYRNLLPLYPTYIEDFDFSDYDLVISSSYLWSKGIITKTGTLHVSYVHTPMRQAWDKYHEYLKNENDIGRFKKSILRYVMNYLRLWDQSSSNRVDNFIVNSTVVQERVNKIYRREANVIHPPIQVKELRKRYFSISKSDYFITVGRLVPYKRVDLLIETFNQLEDKKLLILGEGNDKGRLKSLIDKTKNNVEILGYVEEEKKNKLISSAKAFLFAAEEDFGMSPVEAMAVGTPVIGYKEGGTRDYLINKVNGLTFSEQSSESLKEAILKFENSKFDHEIVSESVSKFDEINFRKLFKREIDRVINENQ
jgi:glycosyltransferase involved in cell wall biosynthesis